MQCSAVVLDGICKMCNAEHCCVGCNLKDMQCSTVMLDGTCKMCNALLLYWMEPVRCAMLLLYWMEPVRCAMLYCCVGWNL